MTQCATYCSRVAATGGAEGITQPVGIRCRGIRGGFSEEGLEAELSHRMGVTTGEEGDRRLDGG
jgi:hypothetical protein